MLSPDERPEGTIRVYFTDNTYKTLKLTYETPASDVIKELCRRISVAGKEAEAENHELFVVAPGNQMLRERRLLPEDRPLQIQKGGSTAFKFLFREVRPAADSSEGAGLDGVLEGCAPVSGRDGSEGAGVPEMLAADAMLRKGSLERLADDSNWYSCTVILGEDRLWYSQAPSSEDGSLGGGMAFLPLSECDRVLECEDKRLLQLVTRGSTLMFRARNGQDRNTWLLAVVKQAALIKERDILLQAERTIASMELRRATRHLERLEELSTLPGLLALPEAREMLLDFAQKEHAASAQGEGSWPEELELQSVLDAISSCREPAKEAGPAWDFVEGALFQRFQDHPAVQNWLCRTACDIG